MNLLELMNTRYSVRAYKPDPVEDEKLQKVLQAACLAPTAANRQPFQFIVVHTAGRAQELQRMYRRSWFVQAPLIICAIGIPSEGWVRGADGKNYTDVDVAIAMDHLILEATELGLGTCWVAAFNPAAVREILCLPPDVDPVALTPLGYPDSQPGSKERKPLSELVHYERWE